MSNSATGPARKVMQSIDPSIVRVGRVKRKRTGNKSRRALIKRASRLAKKRFERLARRNTKMKAYIGGLSQKFNIPFTGLNDDAVNWLRCYINPSDIGKIIPSGIPDKEVAPAATFAKSVTYNYNGETFKSMTFTSDATNNPQVKVDREGYTSTTIILYPNMCNALLVIENGTYSVKTNSTKGGDFTEVGKTNSVAAWFYDNTFIEGLTSEEAVTNADYNMTYFGQNNIIATRMLGCSMTIYNASNIMNQGGQFVCKSFPIQTDYRSANTCTYFGSCPITSEDFNSQGPAYDYKTLKGPEGVYAVSYNWHPEFKYQMPVCNWFGYTTKASFTGYTNRFSVYQGVISQDLQNQKLDNLKQTIFYTPQYNLFTSGWKPGDGILCQPQWENKDPTQAKFLPLMFYTTDDWTWKGMAVNYTNNNIDDVSLNIKTCLSASQMLGPLSKLNTMTNPPPYTEELLTFAALFTREQEHSYPASWNDWSKIWDHIKQFYRSNKDWLKATGRYALKLKGISGVI